MSGLRIHFSYDPKRAETASFAEHLIDTSAQNDLNESDTIVSLGGDGALLHAFHLAVNNNRLRIPIIGITPPGSNSAGFWTHKEIGNADDLVKLLDRAEAYTIAPLKADVKFRNGRTETVRVFNDVAASEHSGQAALAYLTAKSHKGAISPIRIMGDGIIIATAYGSTALNRSYGGPAIDIRNTGIILNGKGVYEPRGGFNPIVCAEDTVFEMTFKTPERRPVRIQHDGSVLRGTLDNPIVGMTVQRDADHSIKLLLAEDPATRAFSAMIPQ